MWHNLNMVFTGDLLKLLDRSEAALKTVMQEFRPRLLAATGTISTNIKNDDTPVTQLDLEVEAAMRRALLSVDSTVGLQGEEHGVEGSNDRFWLIDPIDGTENLVRGIPAFRCMATFVADKELQYTFVYDVAKDELYTARKGQGAVCNGRPLQLSQRPLKRAWIELLCELTLPESHEIIKVIQQNTRGVRIHRDFSYVLNGQFEGILYYKAHGSAWDWTPWALLVKEAGGKVANFGSDSYDYRDPNFLAAPVQIFDGLKPLLDQTLAQQEKA
jgi:myo-inositol-1(or 4)-monophosphatase